MELVLERTGAMAHVGSIPVSLWRVRNAERTPGEGIALVAEIVPLPGPGADYDRLRSRVSAELAGPKPTMWLSPTPQFAAADGAQARLWLGYFVSGIEVAAFVCAVHPHDKAMEQVLQKTLRELDVVLTEVPPVAFDPIDPAHALR